MNKIQKGFTLIELMIVIAIIGILASIAIPSYQDYVGRSQVSEAVTILASYKIGLSEFAEFGGDFGDITSMADIGGVQQGTYVSTIQLVAGADGGTVVIQAVMRTQGVNAQAQNRNLGFGTYDGANTWVCGEQGAAGDPVPAATTIPAGLLPGTCR